MSVSTASGGARVALVGYTGTGKSTIAAAIIEELGRRGQPARLIKLAAPLYRLQQAYYREAGVTLPPDTQDQELLTRIASDLRHLSAAALLNPFLAELAATPPETAIVNDDLRVPDPDAAGLRSAGFCLIRLECPEHVRHARLATRADHTTIDEPAIFGPLISRIRTDLRIDTHRTTSHQAARVVLDHLRDRHPNPRGGGNQCLTATALSS